VCLGNLFPSASQLAIIKIEIMLKQNLEYWDISLKNPEPALDESYAFNDIIVEDEELIDKIEKLRNLIITYCMVLEINKNKHEQVLNEVLDKIYEIVSATRNIQYTEFVAFWKTLDLSYSYFTSLSEQDKKLMLRQILENYCIKRKELYDKLGYSNIVVQALYDSGASRKKGKIGINKIMNLIFEKLGEIKKFSDIEELKNTKCGYFLPDGNKTLFNDFIRDYRLSYRFGERYQNKLPDVVLKVAEHFFIIEAKHINEMGGAQDKQIAELISFIDQSEQLANIHIHYIAFLDGIYFNYFINPTQGSKLHQQKEAIESCLRRNRSNFFVNTAGFTNILEDVSEECKIWL